MGTSDWITVVVAAAIMFAAVYLINNYKKKSLAKKEQAMCSMIGGIFEKNLPAFYPGGSFGFEETFPKIADRAHLWTAEDTLLLKGALDVKEKEIPVRVERIAHKITLQTTSGMGISDHQTFLGTYIIFDIRGAAGEGLKPAAPFILRDTESYFEVPEQKGLRNNPVDTAFRKHHSAVEKRYPWKGGEYTDQNGRSYMLHAKEEMATAENEKAASVMIDRFLKVSALIHSAYPKSSLTEPDPKIRREMGEKYHYPQDVEINFLADEEHLIISINQKIFFAIPTICGSGKLSEADCIQAAKEPIINDLEVLKQLTEIIVHEKSV